MGTVACQKEMQESLPVSGDTVQVTFVAGTADTKTSVDTSGETPVFAWGENETFAVLEQTDALAQATKVTYAKVDGKAHITAEFAANPGKEYDYATIYPASGYVSATGLDKATLSLPAVQTMAEGSYDPNADLMVSEVVSTNAQPTEAQMVGFTRMAAVVKMTLKNLNLDDGDQVEQVIFTAEGKSLAGTITADLAAPKDFIVAEGVDNVTVNTTSSTDVYFTVLPTTLEAGDAYTVTVLTGKKIYIKQGTIPAEKSLAFEKGNVTRLGVNMASVVPSDKWVLVKDASTLKEGDVVAIAAKNYNYVIGKQSSNYPVPSQTEVIKFGDYLYHPVATSETSVDNRIQHYTLLQRDQNRTAFDFYNGVDYEGDTSVGFAFANGTNNSPKLQSWCDNNTLFDVEIVDGIATLKASEIERNYKWWRYYHSTYASSRKFDCTSSVPTGNYQICLYKLQGAVGTIPVVDATVTVPDSDEPVVIAEEGAAVATEISEVVFNYVGDWTITPSTEAAWLNVAYDATKNCLTYTAEANTEAKREAVVTITASLEGQESLTWTFNVLQKGAPQDISIADFVKLSKDENTTYRLTGKVVATATTSGTWKLSDEKGNIAQIKYLKTEDNGNPYLSESDVEVELGDVMTVTAVVTASKASSACGSSNYPSFYKGHYNVSATVTPAVVGYEGGDATVAIAVNAYYNAVAPSTIEATIEDCDFAKLTYTGGSTATVSLDENTGGSRDVDVTFTCGLATSTVTIAQQNHPSVKVGWFLVTDASELKSGDKVIIAAKSPDGTLDYAISSKASTSTFRPSVAISVQGNSIPNVDGVQLYTLENGYADCPGTWAFKGDSDSKYLYYSSGLKVTSTLNANGSWALTVSSDGKATLVSQTTNSKNTMGLNWTISNQTFSMYTSEDALTKGAIYIYKYYN